MTRNLISPKTDLMGRRKKNFENMSAGFDTGTFARIDAVLRDGETRKDLVREGVEMILVKREKQKSRKKSDDQKS